MIELSLELHNTITTQLYRMDKNSGCQVTGLRPNMDKVCHVTPCKLMLYHVTTGDTIRLRVFGGVQLHGLESLMNLTIKECGLERIPHQVTSLAALTSLDVSCNVFRSEEGWQWWPHTLSR
jgi:hypothetical protein